MVIAHSTSRIFSPLLLPATSEATKTVCLTSHGMIRHYLYILAMMMMLMILHYPTRYLYPPLDPARPPTAVAWDDQGASLLRTAIRPERGKGRCRNWSEKPCDSWYGLWRSRWRDEIVFLCGSCRRTDPATSDCSARIAQGRKVLQGCRLTLPSCSFGCPYQLRKADNQGPPWKRSCVFSRTNLVRSRQKVISCMDYGVGVTRGCRIKFGVEVWKENCGELIRGRGSRLIYF